MTKRPDILRISLGTEKPRHKANLQELAFQLELAGRKGNGSISELMVLLSETYEAAADETIWLLNIAREVAAGGDLDELVKF